MKRTKQIIWAGFFALLSLAVVSCGKLDVVGTESVKSFNAILDKAPQEISTDEMTGGWALFSPDRTTKFIWSKNYAESPLHDVMIVFEAQPFINAGLDTDKLPENFTVFEGMIMVGTKLGQEVLKYTGEVTPLASYEQIVKLKRNVIGYHMALDHYGVNLGDGNLFEWAKDMGTNDKDIVFVLNPDPFIAAGVDPSKIEGWVFAKVTVDDANGKPVEVDKILKPFNLK
ncbi:MAG: hypothetical protein LBG05_06125 [Treponema sp.]|jgi:hypothetical protein|nr:hypothetical protein [Treponema sp.]